MLSLKTAKERHAAAQAALQEAHRQAIAADDAVAEAKNQLDVAEDELHKAKWGSVPCPVCGAKRTQNCRLEREAPTRGHGAPGIPALAACRARPREGGRMIWALLLAPIVVMLTGVRVLKWTHPYRGRHRADVGVDIFA